MNVSVSTKNELEFEFEHVTFERKQEQLLNENGKRQFKRRHNVVVVICLVWSVGRYVCLFVCLFLYANL